MKEGKGEGREGRGRGKGRGEREREKGILYEREGLSEKKKLPKSLKVLHNLFRTAKKESRPSPRKSYTTLATLLLFPLGERTYSQAGQSSFPAGRGRGEVRGRGGENRAEAQICKTKAKSQHLAK